MSHNQVFPETLPCFRCAGQIEILVPAPENAPYFGWWCTRCGIRAPRYEFPTPAAAIADANRRACPVQPAGALRVAANWAAQVLCDFERLQTDGRRDGDRLLVHEKGIHRAVEAGKRLRATLDPTLKAAPGGEG